MNSNDESAMHPDFEQDPDYSKLEAALRALRPAEPSSALEERVFAIFDEPEADAAGKIVPHPASGSGNIIHWFRPIAAAAAVATVFLGGVVLLKGPGDSPKESAGSKTASGVEIERYQPVSAGNFFENATDEGVVYPEAGGVPKRQVRYQYHDTYEWKHPEDGSRIRLSVPREELLYLPVETD